MVLNYSCRQLVNFIPGVWEESYSKEALCRNTQRFVAKHGKDTPATYGLCAIFCCVKPRIVLVKARFQPNWLCAHPPDANHVRPRGLQEWIP